MTLRCVSSCGPIVGVVAALLLSGCMSLAPEYQRPAAPVAPTYPGDASGTGQAAADIDWQAYYTDERSKRLIALALQHNRDLRVAALTIEQARAQLQVRRADALPTVNAIAAGSREPGTNGSQTSLYTIGLGVTAWELDFFGRIRNLSDVALSQFYATEEARKAAQIALVAAVVNAQLALQADDELIASTRSTLASREDSLKLTKLKFDNGAASELDLRQAESLLEGANVALAQQQRQRALDENALVLLIGQPLPPDLPPAVPLAEQRLLANLPAGLPSELLDRRPDVRQAERQLIAANANIGAARAAFWPRITLTGTVGIASTELSKLFSDGSSAWTFGPQLVLPIFDAGRNRANLQVAQANRDIAVAQYEKSIQTAFREVADALAGRATLGEQLRAQQAQAQAEEVRSRLADLRYRNGAASYLDVLDAQRSLFTARQAVVQVQLQQAQNLVTLYKVLGGGWTDPSAK
jgi:outer membrane protein, multidrug efflux system